MNYLGYPSAMGADFMDYIVADKTVIPDENRAYYTECILYLPDTYWPFDDRKMIADLRTSRSDFGLPEQGLIFCCFNNLYKISPAEFEIWMRILRQIAGSVLWLLTSNRWARANLRDEAAARGVEAKRLVFTEKLPLAEHLARHKHADLFLDTFNYNAHTTASDALWAGVPVVTKQGRQFSARVASSLLNAAGLPDLVTSSEHGYEKLIVALAQDPACLPRIRTRLLESRLQGALFDTARYTRNFERGLEAAFERHLNGLRPADIEVPSQLRKA